MTVRLLKPYDGKVAGDLYTGLNEEYLVSNQTAIIETGNPAWGTGNTTHTLSARDAARQFEFTANTAVTVRVPKEIDSLPNGIVATYMQSGTGQVSIVGDAGVTVGSTTGFPKTSGQGATMQITKTGARTVYVRGALSTS